MSILHALKSSLRIEAFCGRDMVFFEKCGKFVEDHRHVSLDV